MMGKEGFSQCAVMPTAALSPVYTMGVRLGGTVVLPIYLHYKEILRVAKNFIKKFYYAYRFLVRFAWGSATSKVLEPPTHTALFPFLRQTHST